LVLAHRRTPATRILFDKKRAVGVEIARDAGLEVVMADREVLLAAGGYGSPQLLLGDWPC
jgi:choline dehydrogenase